MEYCISKGWSVFIRFDLHAKTYVVDRKRSLVCSANATNSGLALAKNHNEEIGTLVDIDQEDIDKIDNLFSKALYVDDDVVEMLKKQYEKCINETEDGRKNFVWNKEIRKLFLLNVESLFSYELPNSINFSKGDYLEFLDMKFDGNLDEVRGMFLYCNAYTWLCGVLKDNDNCLYYGAITEKLHNIIIKDPKPYRKDAKILLSNFLWYVENLNIDNLIIDRPNHSQRIRLV